MSQRRKELRTDRVLRHMPTDVLLKARTTLFSLGGALRHKHRDEQKAKRDSKDRSKPKHETLKSSRSEPEFSALEKSRHRHRAEERQPERVRPRPRPQSVGASKRYAYDWQPEVDEWYEYPRRSGSAERQCAQPRPVLPAGTRSADADKPRKKLSFREPEIVGGRSATLARPQRRMGVNSLTLRPQRYSLPPQHVRSSSMENLDSDLESQAMQIVRTVGQAFEVCHKLTNNGEPLPSTSRAIDVRPASDQCTEAPNAAKETGEPSGAVETATPAMFWPEPAPPRSPVPFDEIIKEELVLPQIKTDGPNAQIMVTAPTMKLPVLPECVTKVEVVHEKIAMDAPLAVQHQVQMLQERLEQQAQQTSAAVAQLILMREQLNAEQTARCEAQARTHQLLNHNKELLEHIASLVGHLKERESGKLRSTISQQHLTLLPQSSKNVDARPASNVDDYKNNNNKYTNIDTTMNSISHNQKVSRNSLNNNTRSAADAARTGAIPKNGPRARSCQPALDNDGKQDYLVDKFQAMGGYPKATDERKSRKNTFDQQCFRNNSAFQHVALPSSPYSNVELGTCVAPEAYGCQRSPAGSSKESSPGAKSSDEAAAFIMPLSHRATLATAADDGRVRFIVPVSPSPSAAEVRHATAPKIPERSKSKSLLTRHFRK